MTYDEIHPVIRAALGAHEGFRKRHMKKILAGLRKRLERKR